MLSRDLPEKKAVLKLPLYYWIFCLGILMKPFYILPSGSFQIGDLLMILAVILYFIFQKKFRISIKQEELPFLLFFLFVCLINFTYSIVLHSHVSKANLYYLYNLLVILFFSDVLDDEKNNFKFLLLLRIICILDIIVQLCVFLIGAGRWLGASRYMGTFNDPNQYGVFVLFSMLIAYMISVQFEKKKGLILIIGSLAIFPSSSVGMLGGLLVLYVAILVVSILQKNKKMLIAMAVAIFILIIIFCIAFDVITLPSYITNHSMYKRFIKKIFELFLNNNSTRTVADDRCWNMALNNPEYFLFGAGEGHYSRFNSVHEIHSSVLGPLFYYGCVPFGLLCAWYFKKIKGIKPELYCVFACLLVESVFLVNTRQPTYWMLFLLAGFKLSKKSFRKDRMEEI